MNSAQAGYDKAVKGLNTDGPVPKGDRDGWGKVSDVIEEVVGTRT